MSTSSRWPRAFSRAPRLTPELTASRLALIAALAASPLFFAGPAQAIPSGTCDVDSALLNGSFESPSFPASFQLTYVKAANDPSPAAGIGWSTTASDHEIELWASLNNPSPSRTGQYGENGIAADSGVQFAELNANMNSTLYQDRPTVPGSTIRWALAHRGRDGAETMNVNIGPVAGPLVSQTPDGASSTELTDGINAWGQYTGTYVVPSGQTETRFAFVSQTPASGGQGNFLDSVRFDVSATACLDSATTVVDQPVFIDALANDRGDQIVLGQPVQAPAHGTVTRIGGQYRYQPAAGFTGSDSFTYEITDSFGTTAIGTVEVTVNPPSSSPPAAPDLVSSDDETLNQTATIPIPAGATPRLLDEDGVPRTVVDVPGVGRYTLDVDTGEITFDPSATFIGTAPIDYQLTDDNGDREVGTYRPTVQAVVRSTNGLGDFPQHAELNFAPGGSVGFVAPGGAVVQELVVPGIGRYRVSNTGSGTFEPAAGYVGTPPARVLRFTDATGEHADGSWEVDVTAAPIAADFQLGDKNTYGDAGETQSDEWGWYPEFSDYTVDLAFGDDAGSYPDGRNPLTVPGVGTFATVPGSFRLQFTPVPGFFGGWEIPFKVVSSFGFSESASYSVYVNTADGGEGNPTPATGVDVASTGVGTATQSASIDVPSGGSAYLLRGDGDGAPAFSTWTDPGKGTFSIDAATGRVSFKAVLGYVGTPHPIHYMVLNASGSRTVALYSPVVERPAGPATVPAETTGPVAALQSTAITVPEGGSVTLLSDTDQPTNRVVISSEGTYELNPSTGVVTFSADAGFTGRARGVRFQVTDAYGQTASGVYAATVIAPAVSAPAVPVIVPATAPAPLPAAQVCTSKRVFDVHWRVPGRQRIRSITVSLDGAKGVRLSGKARKARVDLRGRVQSRVVLTVKAKLVGGRTLTGTRDYHPCTAAKPGDVKTLRLSAKC